IPLSRRDIAESAPAAGPLRSHLRSRRIPVPLALYSSRRSRIRFPSAFPRCRSSTLFLQVLRRPAFLPEDSLALSSRREQPCRWGLHSRYPASAPWLAAQPSKPPAPHTRRISSSPLPSNYFNCPDSIPFFRASSYRSSIWLISCFLLSNNFAVCWFTGTRLYPWLISCPPSDAGFPSATSSNACSCLFTSSNCDCSFCRLLRYFATVASSACLVIVYFCFHFTPTTETPPAFFTSSFVHTFFGLSVGFAG